MRAFPSFKMIMSNLTESTGYVTKLLIDDQLSNLKVLLVMQNFCLRKIILGA